MAKAKKTTPPKKTSPINSNLDAIAAFDHDGDGRPGGSLPRETRGHTVTVTEKGAGLISDGNGGTYPAGAVIPATPAQAAGLRASGYAE